MKKAKNKCPECKGKMIRTTRDLREFEDTSNPWPFLKITDEPVVVVMTCEDCGRAESEIRVKNKGWQPKRRWTIQDNEKVRKVKKLKKEGKWDDKLKKEKSK